MGTAGEPPPSLAVTGTDCLVEGFVFQREFEASDSFSSSSSSLPVKGNRQGDRDKTRQWG